MKFSGKAKKDIANFARIEIKITSRMNALLIIDMQNGFLEKDAPIFVPGGIEICENIVKALESARSRNFKIIWTQVNIEKFRNTQYEKLFPTHFSLNDTVLSKGSHNYDLIDRLKDQVNSETDLIIEKDTYSAFINTDLEKELLKNNIINLYFTGVSTNVCVESTLRDAFQRNFNCFLISDCTKTFSTNYQKFSEEIISFTFGNVISINEFITKKA